MREPFVYLRWPWGLWNSKVSSPNPPNSYLSYPFSFYAWTFCRCKSTQGALILLLQCHRLYFERRRATFQSIVIINIFWYPLSHVFVRLRKRSWDWCTHTLVSTKVSCAVKRSPDAMQSSGDVSVLRFWVELFLTTFGPVYSSLHYCYHSRSISRITNHIAFSSLIMNKASCSISYIAIYSTILWDAPNPWTTWPTGRLFPPPACTVLATTSEALPILESQKNLVLFPALSASSPKLLCHEVIFAPLYIFFTCPPSKVFRVSQYHPILLCRPWRLNPTVYCQTPTQRFDCPLYCYKVHCRRPIVLTATYTQVEMQSKQYFAHW